jgi:hypothetical protein
MDGFFAVVAPAGTPADIVGRLNREIGEYLKGLEIQQRLISFGLATEGAGTPFFLTTLLNDHPELMPPAKAGAPFPVILFSHGVGAVPEVYALLLTDFAAHGYASGISLGGTKFIHAENEDTGVVISDLNSDYYTDHYAGARRLL